MEELGTLTSPSIPADIHGERHGCAGNLHDRMGAGGRLGHVELWRGDDADDFSINGGVLAFDVRPQLRGTQWADADGDSNTYMVTVKADSGGEMAMAAAITVMVTNVEELGTLTSPSIPCRHTWRTARVPWEPSRSDGRRWPTRSRGCLERR